MKAFETKLNKGIKKHPIKPGKIHEIIDKLD